MLTEEQLKILEDFEDALATVSIGSFDSDINIEAAEKYYDKAREKLISLIKGQ